VVAGAILSGPVAMLVVTRAAPQPAWVSVEVFAEHYRAIQALPYVLGFILLVGFVLFAASCHALAGPGLRMRTSAALVFTAVYAALVFTNYTIQAGFIPRMVGERPEYLAALTMSNPRSFAWFLEMFGYAAMGIATWLAARGFGGSTRSTIVRYLLVANGILSVAGAACISLVDAWVFSRAGLLSFAAWNVLIICCYLLIAISDNGCFGILTEPS
jgi:hypothetical protein